MLFPHELSEVCYLFAHIWADKRPFSCYSEQNSRGQLQRMLYILEVLVTKISFCLFVCMKGKNGCLDVNSSGKEDICWFFFF